MDKLMTATEVVAYLAEHGVFMDERTWNIRAKSGGAPAPHLRTNGDALWTEKQVRDWLTAEAAGRAT